MPRVIVSDELSTQAHAEVEDPMNTNKRSHVKLEETPILSVGESKVTLIEIPAST